MATASPVSIRRVGVVAALAILVIVVLVSLKTAGPASAHRSWCHAKHECPSDHATYRWRGLLCVSPNARERDSSFTQRVRFQGRTYYCKR